MKWELYTSNRQNTETYLTLFNSKRHNKYALKERMLRILFAIDLITIYIYIYNLTINNTGIIVV